MWEYTIEAMEYFATMYQTMMKQALLQRVYPYGNPNVTGQGDKYASGDLYNSITATVEIDANGEPVIYVEYLDYYFNVNRGRQPGGKKVPIAPLLSWIRIRGIKPDDTFATKSLAYAINNKRKKTNKKPIPLDILKKWIEKKGIRLSEDQKTMSLAFAIQQNIFRYGIRPANIYDRGLDAFEDQLDNPPPNLSEELERVYAAMAEDINMLIEKTITKEIPTT
jgi:hypothetical protein